MQGHLDTPLSEVGLKQAEMVGEALSEVRFDAVYASDLCRAVQTACAIMRHQDCPLVKDRRLREIHMGLFQGLTIDEGRERFPEFWKEFISDERNARHPEGESLADLEERSWRAMDDIYGWNATRPGGATVAVVTHGGTIRAILKKANPDPEIIADVVGNCSVSVMECENGAWRIVSIGDCGHLS